MTETDPTITFTNAVFDTDASLYINWLGSGTLTIVNSGTSNITYDKVNSTAGGGIVIENPATLTIQGIIDGGELRIYDDETPGDNRANTELAGIEANTGTTFQYNHTGVTNDIIIQMMATGYEEIRLPFQLNSSNQTVTLTPKVELNA